MTTTDRHHQLYQKTALIERRFFLTSNNEYLKPASQIFSGLWICCGSGFAVGVDLLWEWICCGGGFAVGVDLLWEWNCCGSGIAVGVELLWEPALPAIGLSEWQCQFKAQSPARPAPTMI
jgi:hypothetical protein